MKKYEHLPIFGIGPAYVVSILLPTIIAVILKNNHVFTSGRPITLRIPFTIVGVVFIICHRKKCLKDGLKMRIMRVRPELA